MSDELRVAQLLDDLLDADATPEAVCAACPELLPEVRARWQQMCRVQAELDALFPPALESGTPSAELAHGANLPQIPGYSVETVLGRGGMGVVFRARHLRLNRVVALKMALAGAYAGPSERARFQREAEAVASLCHPNIVQIHDVGDSDGRAYFTMEFVEGGSLAQQLANGPQPARQAAVLLATLASAVQAAHDGGIVHRDLKPANVLLTADGTPKISDFGLARRLDGGTGLTQPGAAIGTPNYMAPEQARGEPRGQRPAVDLYALGAILYELLTGQPPFEGKTPAETIYQVIFEDPVPPARRNANVPRDLEIICLKCLHKEPGLRYGSAAELADDLARFLRGEAITARPEGQVGRVLRRVRQRPALAAVLTVGMLFAITFVAVGAWLLTERNANLRAAEADWSATERIADDDLREMATQLNQAAWPLARAALERAKGRLGDRGSADLRRRIDQGTQELDLAQRLETIRGEVAKNQGRYLKYTAVDPDYEATFRTANLGPDADHTDDNIAVVAARIRASNIPNTLQAALDHWYICASDARRSRWVLRVAAAVIPEPTVWQQQARDPILRKDPAVLAQLVADAPVANESLALLLTLAQLLPPEHAHRLPFLQKIQHAHPDDLWANLALGDALLADQKPAEALRYFQTITSLRPKLLLGYHNLGLTLTKLGRYDEAVVQLRKALAIDATPGPTHLILATIYFQLQRHEEALAELEIAMKYLPQSGLLQTGYAGNLEALGKTAEAQERFQRGIALEPTNFVVLIEYRHFLMRHGRISEACAAWGQALATKPAEHKDWYGYAELCLFLGLEDEYRQAQHDLLAQFGSSTDPSIAERTARASLLLPIAGDELNQAVLLAGRAAAVERSKNEGLYPYYQFVRGLAEYRQGQFERAIATLRGDATRMAGPAPRLVLALALHQNGQEAEARKTLATAIVGHDWQANRVRDQDGWIYHVLRREAERMILPNLPAFLTGTYEPQDNAERLALLGVCQFTNRTHAMTRLYTAAFAADAQLANDLYAGHRSNAARVAALAGCGHGTDTATLSAAERAQLRAQARHWLRENLAAYNKAVMEGDPKWREYVRRTLEHWRNDPPLTGIRELAELDKLPADEQADCRALWAEVERLFARCGPNK